MARPYIDLRQQYNLSKIDLAGLLGVSLSTIRRRENVDIRGQEHTREQILALKGLESELFMERVMEADHRRNA